MPLGVLDGWSLNGAGSDRTSPTKMRKVFPVNTAVRFVVSDVSPFTCIRVRYHLPCTWETSLPACTRSKTYRTQPDSGFALKSLGGSPPAFSLKQIFR